MTEPDPLEELATLTSALRAHAELCGLSGAVGLPPARRSADAAAADVRVGEAPGAHPRATSTSAAPPPQAERSVRPAPPAPNASADTASERTSLPLAPGAERLAALAREVAGCERCGLHRDRTQTVFARGTGSSGLCFVGEGPGADEDAQGLPFVGKAGQLLDRMIAAMGFQRDEVYVCNIVKCRPPKNRKPEPDEMATCRPYLVEQLELVEPKVIVALGATAVEGLLGISGGITRLRGNWRLYKGRIAVMPTFHPAYLLRTPEAKRDVWNDLKEVLKHMGRPVPG
jgi:DNA polymerase